MGEKGAKDAKANNSFYANIRENVGYSSSKSETSSYNEGAATIKYGMVIAGGD